MGAQRATRAGLAWRPALSAAAAAAASASPKSQASNGSARQRRAPAARLLLGLSAGSLAALLCVLLLLHLRPSDFRIRLGAHRAQANTSAAAAAGGSRQQEATAASWLLFEAHDRDELEPGERVGRAREPRASGFKWAPAALLDDFGEGIEPALEWDAAEAPQTAASTRRVETLAEGHHHNSKTRRDAREMRARLKAARETPTRAPARGGAGGAQLDESRRAGSFIESAEQVKMRWPHELAVPLRLKRRAGAPASERGRPILNEFSFPANLVQGMRFVLMCQVLDGEPPIQIRWLKDNADLAALAGPEDRAHSPPNQQQQQPQQADQVEMVSNDELGSSLLFRRVRQHHGGNYTCLASNHLGSASYSSLMTVKVPPTWRVEPQDHESIMGDQITIDCQAAGNPNPFIRWKFASGLQFDKMTFAAAPDAQAGAWSGLPGADSRADLLQALGPGSGQLQATGALTSGLQDGQQQQQHPLSSFKLINSNHHVQTLENGSLIIRQAGREHEGLYLCEADNGVEPSLVKQMKLIVHRQVHFVDDIQVSVQPQLQLQSQLHSPQQQQQQQRQDALGAPRGSIIVGDRVGPPPPQHQAAPSVKSVRLPQNSSLVRLVCSPLGDAPIQLEWLKDGRLIHTHSSGPAPSSSGSSSSSSSNNNNNNNELTDDGPSDHSATIGRYHVSTRWNFETPASRTATVAAQAGAPSRIQAPVSGVAAGLESELLLANLNRHDAGLYTCAARNAFGQAEQKLRLVVQEPPEPPALVDVAHISSRAIALRWAAPFDGNSPITKYVIEYRRHASARPLSSAAQASQQEQQHQQAHQPHQAQPPLQHDSALAPASRSEKLMPSPRGATTGAGVGALDAGALALGHHQQQQQLLAGPDGGGGAGAAQIQHTVHDLEPLTSYSMQVIAVNALGQSRPSVALSLRTEEEVPNAVPNLVEAAVLSSKSIKLRWTVSYALERELIDGFFIGYRSFDAAAAAASSAPGSALLLQGDVGALTPQAELDAAAANSIPGAGSNPKLFTYRTIRLTNQQQQQQQQLGEQQGGAEAASTVLAPVASVTKLVRASAVSGAGALAGASGAFKSGAAPASGPEELAYVMSSFEHVITGLERNTEYTFMIQCFNKKGAGPASDPAVAKTLANDPPEKLVLVAEELPETTSLRVSWHFPGELALAGSDLARASASAPGSGAPQDPVDGFLLTFAKVAPRAPPASGPRSRGRPPAFRAEPHPQQHARNQHLQQQQQLQQPAARISGQQFSSPPMQPNQLLDHQWQAVQLAPQQRSHTLKQLECGSWYALKISAFNRMGKGEPSDLVTVATRGRAPLAPARSQFLAANSSQVRLHLSAWHDGGCPIEKFTVQYRAAGAGASVSASASAAPAPPSPSSSSASASPGSGAEWILVSNNILRDQGSVLIRDLAPASTYELLVGAQNHVGLSEAKYRFSTLDLEGKQVAVGGHSFLGATSDGAEDAADENDANSFVDYSDESAGARRDSYGAGQEGPSSMYLPAGGAPRWLLVARQVLNSPLTLLLTFCVFLVLLGLLLFHRFNGPGAGPGPAGHHNSHHHHHQNLGAAALGRPASSATLTGRVGAQLAGNKSAPGAPDLHLLARCSIDGLATIVDGEPPPPPSSSSAATDSPARVQMAGAGGAAGELRLPSGHYAPLDCYGDVSGGGAGAFCSQAALAPPPPSNGSGQENSLYGQQAAGGDCYASSGNYSTALGHTQQQQGQSAHLGPYYQHHAPAGPIYGTSDHHHHQQQQQQQQQQCLMQMLLMSPGQVAAPQVEGAAAASALATMARHKAGLFKQAAGACYANGIHNNQNNSTSVASMTLGRQLADMHRAAHHLQDHQAPATQGDSYQMITFGRQPREPAVGVDCEEPMACANTANSSVTSGCGTLTIAASASSQSGPWTSEPPAPMGSARQPSGRQPCQSEISCDSALEESCAASDSNQMASAKCDRSIQYDVPFRGQPNPASLVLRSSVGSQL